MASNSSESMFCTNPTRQIPPSEPFGKSKLHPIDQEKPACRMHGQKNPSTVGPAERPTNTAVALPTSTGSAVGLFAVGARRNWHLIGGTRFVTGEAREGPASSERPSSETRIRLHGTSSPRRLFRWVAHALRSAGSRRVFTRHFCWPPTV